MAPRKWLLIAREVPIPGEQAGGAGWALDHLFLDQDAVVDRLDHQALAALEARNPEPAEHTRGVTDRSVTPRQDLVELRGVELEKSALMPAEDDIIPIPASRRGHQGRRGAGPTG